MSSKGGPSSIYDSPDTSSQMSTPCFEVCGTQGQQNWQKDSDVLECNHCHKSFTLTRRKSHCRACGFIFCSDCVAHKIEFPNSTNWKGKQKLCNNCYFYIIGLEIDKKGHAIEFPNYQLVRAEIHKELEDILKTDEGKWKLTCTSRGATIHKLLLPNSNIFCFRSSVVVEKSPAAVWKIYKKSDVWKNWQPDMDNKSIETIDEFTEVIYISYHFPMIIDNRDSCMYSFWINGTFDNPNDTSSFSLFSRSIKHPKCPESPGFVRAFLSLSYTSITPVIVNNETHSKITSYLHFDPRGLIPAFFVNNALSNAVDSILVMKKWMETHEIEYPN